MGQVTISRERFDKLYYYSPYHFIQEIDPDLQFEILISKVIEQFPHKQGHKVIEVEVNAHIHYFYVSYLTWDSGYFQIPTYKIFTVLYQHSHFLTLCEAIILFKQSYIDNEKKYCFAELPVEDTILLQAFTKAGFGLIETRLTYYKKDVLLYESERFTVRKTTADDIPNLRKVAAISRNAYDRIHADIFFLPETADQYLATYAEECVRGFADMVLVPAEKNMSPDGFVAINFLQKDSQMLKCRLSRIVLSAVAPSCRGWHYKLISEAIQQVKSKGSSHLLMTTQAANRPVIRNCEKLGFQLGATSHILSAYTQ